MYYFTHSGETYGPYESEDAMHDAMTRVADVRVLDGKLTPERLTALHRLGVAFSDIEDVELKVEMVFDVLPDEGLEEIAAEHVEGELELIAHERAKGEEPPADVGPLDSDDYVWRANNWLCSHLDADAFDVAFYQRLGDEIRELVEEMIREKWDEQYEKQSTDGLSDLFG